MQHRIAGVFALALIGAVSFVPGAVTAAQNAGANPAPGTSKSAPPPGKYACHFYGGGTLVLHTSSLTEVNVLPGSRLWIVGETVPFSFENGRLALTSGAFKGAVAHMRTSSNKPAIVFIRKENEARGHKIDISDTWCYYQG